jgi:hypothetical protein
VHGNSPGSADTLRAHTTNMAALGAELSPAGFQSRKSASYHAECLRDIGLEQECMDSAIKGDCMLHSRWAHSVTGEEYARIYSWGNDPKGMVSRLATLYQPTYKDNSGRL